MKLKGKIALLILLFLMPLFSLTFAQEQLTITTYYPSPYGSYAELRADRMSVGSGYRTATIPADGLLVQGRVGIGEVAPGSKLSVSGGATIGVNYDTTAAPSNGMIIEGNVGIGTMAPDAGLEVTKWQGNWTTDNWNKNLLINSPGTDDSCLIFGRRNGWVHGIGVTTDGILRFIRSEEANEGLPAHYDMVINNSGNVGIGTTAPGSKLTVTDFSTVAGSTVLMSEQTGTAGAGGTVYAGIFRATGAADENVGARFEAAGASSSNAAIWVPQDRGGVSVGYGTPAAGWSNPPNNGLIVRGNVGIGTTNPQAALDMGTGGIRLGGETRTTWPAVRVCIGSPSNSDLGCPNPSFPTKLGQWHSKNFAATWVCGYVDCQGDYTCQGGDLHRAVWLCAR